MLNKFLLSVSLLLLINFCEANSKKKIYIADRKIFCKEIIAGCLQVKEKTKGTWQSFSGIITGFDYKEGYEYQVLLELEGKTKFSAAKGNYKVLKVVSKKKTDFNPATHLDGKKWMLLSMDDTHRVIKIGDSTVFVKFNTKEGKLSGHATCNSFNATVKSADATNISIDAMAATKMLCAGDNKMTFEKIVLNFISESKTYQLEGNTLKLMAPNGDNMVFVSEWVVEPKE